MRKFSRGLISLFILAYLVLTALSWITYKKPPERKTSIRASLAKAKKERRAYNKKTGKIYEIKKNNNLNRYIF